MAVDMVQVDEFDAGVQSTTQMQMAKVFGIQSQEQRVKDASGNALTALLDWAFETPEAITKEKTSYYWTHRKTILDREKNVSRVTVHVCSCGKSITPYHNAKKHAELTGHKLVEKRQNKIQRQQKTAEQSQKIDIRISMGPLGYSRAESKENWQ